MIYNEKFVWLHFPKCAGTKIEHLFAEYFSNQAGLFQDHFTIDKDPSVSWHDSIADRKKRDHSFEPGSRIIVCSFRRLANWLESRYNFEYLRSPKLPHRPEQLLEGRFLESTGYNNHADYYVKKYLPEEVLGTGRVRFLRTEFFESDFKSIFGDYMDISIIPDEKFKKKVNVSKTCLPDDIREQLYVKSRNIYEACPYWQRVEALAYSDIE